MWKGTKISLKYKVAGLAVASFLAGMVAINLQNYHIIEETALDKARTVADFYRDIRVWSAGYNGIWTKDSYYSNYGYFLKGKTDKVEVLTPKNVKVDEWTKVHFYLHDPALISKEIATIMKKEDKITVKGVSDRPVSPSDIPDKFEKKALELFRQGKTEYYGWENGKFRYVRALRVTEACLPCHGDKNHINPIFYKAMKDKYGDAVDKAIGYKVGEVRGAISISFVPKTDFGISKVAIGLIGLIALMIFLILQFMIVKPIEFIRENAEKIAKGKLSEVDLKVQEFKGREVADELTALAIAIDKIKNSIQIAFKKLKRQ